MSETEGALVSSEVSGAVSPIRSPLQHMLHALKQPLTGLHCSLELALVGQRTPEQYLRTLREGLELAGRMSILVAAIGELVESEEEHRQNPAHHVVVELHQLLRETVDELQPVAEAQQVHILLDGQGPLPVLGSRPQLAGAVFRFLDSALSLTGPGNELRLQACPESGQARLEVCWEAGAAARDFSLFSRPQLGLLLAEAAWKRIGGKWSSLQWPEKSGRIRSVLAWLPLAIANSEQTMNDPTIDDPTLHA
jgi:hypothetical protein